MLVSTTVAKLKLLGIKVYCLALGDVDLTSPARKMIMGVINNVAQFERNPLIERTQYGLDRAKANGKPLGRPNVLSGAQKIQTIQQLKEGKAVVAIARDLNVSRQTVMRVRNAQNQ